MKRSTIVKMGGDRRKSNCYSGLTFVSKFARSKRVFSKLAAARAAFVPRIEFAMGTNFCVGCNVHGFSNTVILTLISGRKGVGRFVAHRISIGNLGVNCKDKGMFSYSVTGVPRRNSQV